MDHTPHKSRALIITIIAVIILLIVGYFLFFRSGQVLSIKSSSDSGDTSSAASNIKSFISLIFKPKAQQQATDVVTDSSATDSSSNLGNGSTTTGGQNRTDNGTLNGSGGLGNTGVGSSGTGISSSGGLGAGDGTSGSGGFSTGSYAPTLIPLPTPTNNTSDTTPNSTTPECSDGIDNNNNGLIDIDEPGCHDDFNIKNTTSYDPSIDNEGRSNPITQTSDQNMCPSDDPLVFTDAEKAQLDSLLTQYYLIAPELKTSDDLTLLSDNITTDQAIIDQANTLTQQCESDKADPRYTGPQYVEDNPYYKGGSNTPSYIGSLTFTPTSTDAVNPTDPGAQSYGYFENKFNIW